MELIRQTTVGGLGLPWMYLGPFVWVLYILTLLMIIDCAINRRDLYWFFLLVVLGPLGGVAYLIYHFEHVTFPFRVAQLKYTLSAGGGQTARRCQRCGSLSPHMVRFQDARSILVVCPGCSAELEASRRR